MKKLATTEEKVAFVAKKLLKEFKSDQEASGISITSNFSEVSSNKFDGLHTMFRCGHNEEVDFGEMSDEAFGSLTCRIADAICAKFKVKKNEILYRDVREDTKWSSGMWYSHSSKYYTTKRILLIRPCKEFFAINKKLKSLGLSEIHFKDWYHCDVAGKRSSIFSRNYSYYAENKGKCQKVLDYLKGKKKLTYSYVNVDDLEDRTYGEEYETEWYGSESKQIQFKDAQGKTTTIY